MAKLIRYVWTAEDQRIAGGNTAQSVQGPYVTPYGIRAASIPKCATFSAGTSCEIDLDLSTSGEPWRAARRFHAGEANFEWREMAIPGDVKTLAELCKYLREKDASQYPETIYGEKKVGDAKGVDNPARMLFDYWQNSSYRYAIVEKAFDWKTYATDPGSIPIRKDGVALSYVMRKVTPLPKVAAAPGAQKKVLDFSSLVVDHYINLVIDAAANIRSQLALSERLMRARYQPIYRLQALRAIAEASPTNPIDGFTSDGAKIVALVDSVLPRVQKVLVDQPLVHPAISAEQKLGEIFKTRKEFTMDVVAELRAEQQKLRALLLEKSEHARLLKKWITDNHGNLLSGQPGAAAVVDRLLKALAEGHLALGECEGEGHDDVLEALLDRVREGHATRPEDIDGESATVVALSLVGKGLSLSTTAVGNLAGPPSLSIAMLQVYGVIRFARIAKLAQAELSAIPSSIFTIAIRTEKWIELSDRLVRYMPDCKAKQAVGTAMIREDWKALAKLRDDVGGEIAGAAQQTVAWKGVMVIFGLLSVILSIREAAKAPDNRHGALKALDWVSSANAAASVSIGGYETFLTALGRLEKVSEGLAKAGCVIGLLGCVMGMISGAVGWAEAYGNASGYGMASNAFGAVGSLGMAIVAACAIFKVALPVLSVVCLACLLASGAVSVGEILDSLDTTATKTKKLCHGLVLSVRKDVIGEFAEWAEATLVSDMDDLEKITKEGTLPNPKNDYFVVIELTKAGLSKSMIQEVVNASALATTPFGPGVAPGVQPI